MLFVTTTATLADESVTVSQKQPQIVETEQSSNDDSLEQVKTVTDTTYNEQIDFIPPIFTTDHGSDYTVIQSTYGTERNRAFSLNSSSIEVPPPDPTLLKTINNLNTKNISSIFSLDQENEYISPLDGSLSVSSTDLYLPGRNGLSFSLKRYYNSSNSSAFDKQTEFTFFCVCAVRIQADIVIQYSRDGVNVDYAIPQQSGYIQYDTSHVTDGTLENMLDAVSWFAYIQDFRGQILNPSAWAGPDDNGNMWRAAYYVHNDAHSELINFYEDGPFIPIWRNIANKKSYEQQIYPLGAGWTWDIPYIKTVEGSSYLNMGSGGTYEISGNSLKGYPWKDLTIENNSSVNVNGEWSAKAVKSIHGRSYYFASDGRLIQIADPYGNTIQFKYSQNAIYGKVLTTISDAIGNSIQISYDEWGITLVQGDKTIRYTKSKIKKQGKLPFRPTYESEYLSAVSDPMGRTTHYSYQAKDANFNLNHFAAENNQVYLLNQIQYANGAKTTYTYESSPITRLIGPDSASEQTYRIHSRKDIDNSVDYNQLSFTYQSDIGSSYNQDITSFGATIDNGYAIKKFDYEKDYIDDNTPAVFYLNSIEETVGIESRTTAYLYDRARKITEPIQTTNTYRKGNSSGMPIINKVTYDDYGNILTQTNAINVTTNYSYHPTTHLLSNVSEKINENTTRNTQYTRNSQGTITEVAITDQPGTLLSQSKYENIDPYGNIGKITVRDDNQDTVYIMEYGYSGAFPIKQSINVTNADQQTSTIIYQMGYDSTTGLVTSSTDGKNNTTQYEYDKLGRLTKVIHPDLSFSTAAYNDALNQVTVTDETGVTTRQTWDSLGQKREVGIVDGSYRMLNRFGYDHLGRLSTEWDANGRQTTYEYNAWNQLIKTNLPTATLSSSTVEYDEINRTTTTRDPEGIQTKSFYDLLGRQTSMELNKGTGFQNVGSTQYDYAGNVISRSDAQHSTSFKYDALGRLTQVTDPQQNSTSYFYSLAGNLKEIRYPDGKSVYKEADQLGRIIKETDQTGQIEKSYYDANNNIERTVDKKGQQFTFQYNNRNFLVNKSSPMDNVAYTYDQAGRRLTMIDSIGLTRYSYKATTGELIEVTFPDLKKISYTYNNLGLRETLIGPFGYKNVYTYDSMNRLKTVGSSTDTFDAEYEYLNNNQLKSIKQLNGNLSSFTYDGYTIKTLTQTKSNGEVINFFDYDHDTNQNIIKQVARQNGSDQTFQYTYDALNRIETSSQFNESYTYDKRGNRLTIQSNRNLFLAAGDTSYTYDAWNRLTDVAKAAGERVSYKYNGDGLLVERTENNDTVRYYYDGDQIVAEGKVTNGIVTAKAQYVRGQGLVAGIGSNGKYYYLQNGHGDVVELRDSTGNTSLNRYTYDMWGNPLTTVETVSNPFRYSGELWDQQVGLQHLRARWYDPSMGRFISEDTYEGEINNPLSQNRYTYVHNNPLIYTDPTGHYCVSANGKYAQTGTCKSSDSVYLGEDSDFIGRPIIWKEQVMGFISESGTSYNSVHYTQNYWTSYPDDYSYVRWLAGDNDYYYSLDRDTQLRLRDRLLKAYMKTQIEQGFPDFVDGYLWGRTLAKQGITAMMGVKKKGKELRGGSKSSRDNWYGYNDKEFQKWWHREGKREFGGNDIDNSSEAKAVYDYWVSIGKPKVK